MRFQFQVVIDLETGSEGSDAWAAVCVELGDIFAPDIRAGSDQGPIALARSGKARQTAPSEALDWRFGPVAVEVVDLDEPAAAPAAEQAPPMAHATLAAPKARFLGNGIIHVFRDEASAETAEREAAAEERKTEAGSKVLAILAVPSYMTVSDLLGFVGKLGRDTVSHLRMLRSTAANRYMVLLKFRETRDADAFYRDYNGKEFNSMDPETCHVVYVSSVRVHRSSSGFEFPHVLHDFPPDEPAVGSSLKPAPPPTKALRELPTCPVCLERMDASVTGLLTIICQHTFHCQCLSRWGDSSCPVCRYSQKRDRSQASTPGRCRVCASTANLWVCLICGSVGCGRYDDAHAFQHYMDTNHIYAMDLESQRVWDYVGDGYVHRLIQNQSDGKLVELPPADKLAALAGSSSDDRAGPDYVPREKLDSIGMEYTFLLTSQLESQRVYFEDLLAAAADKVSASAASAERAAAAAAAADARLAALEHDHAALQAERPQLEREHTRAQKKADTLQALASRLQKEWHEEKSMNDSMMAKLARLTTEKDQQAAEIAELRDQLRDLMFFLDAQQKLQDVPDAQDGTVSIPDAPAKGKRKGKQK
ncbi:BRCA1-associated protein 2-domain-containing protein [Dipodascopsis tothii]|uniref:BRCA1-associated protein 2-domain-containing protein n=1 Tax=Dipodascopsis tothii TaxID=44089 RepID=UPI0034CE4374